LAVATQPGSTYNIGGTIRVGTFNGALDTQNSFKSHRIFLNKNNIEEAFSNDTNNLNTMRTIYSNILIHEICHTMGLNHCTETACVIYATCNHDYYDNASFAWSFCPTHTQALMDWH